jgi:hypothetical protein
MLKSEGLPQTWQVSCGLSLITSQSAQNTAFRKLTALIPGVLLASMDTSSFVTYI